MGLTTILSVPLFVVILCVALQFGIEYRLRKSYHVHETGVIFITGTSSGIGRHTVFALAKEGYHVFGTVRSKNDVASLSEEGKKLNLESHVHPIIMDVRNSSQIDQAYQTIIKFINESKLPLAGIINNAGVSYTSPFESMKEDKIREIISTNIIGAMMVTQKFLALIREYKGRVFFISGISGFVSRYGQSIFSASKHSLEVAVGCIRQEMLSFNVSVIAILPGCVIPSKEEKNPVDIPHNLLPMYGEKMKNMVEFTRKRLESCSPPSVTSDTIFLALRDPYPDTKYYVGNTGIIPMWLWRIFRIFLMDRLLDLVKEWEVGFTLFL